jgi:hypothetical protein
MAVSLRERALYHQIHPAKLATDILSEPISLWLLWEHRLWLGLAVHFLPPIVASALVMSLADHERLKSSGLGRYVEQHMSRPVEAARLGGDLVMVIGAWLHAPWVIGFGLIIVIGAWLRGVLTPPAA